MGRSRSGPGRLRIRLRILRLRSRRILRLRSRVFLRLRFRVFSGRVAVTRKSPQFGIVRTCSSLNYSINSGGFRAFTELLTPKLYNITLGLGLTVDPVGY